MPAEWEPHEATWLTWPHDDDHWPGIFEGIPQIWAQMVKALETGEDVHLAIHDDATEENAQLEMKKAGVQGDRVFLHRIPNNFSWARDHGPILVKNDATGERILTEWQYNAWGGKWDHHLDDEVPSFVAKETGLHLIKVPMVLEGGSISVNGTGSLLTTEACLLHPNRNPTMNKETIEQHLKDNLGVSNILWLNDGIEGDDTNGHVDDLTQFVSPNSVVTIVEENEADANYTILQENLARLRTMKNETGELLKIHELPMPAEIRREDMRLPATYANFYVANEVVLMPGFNDPNDDKAAAVLQLCFPSRKIVQIDTRELVFGLGAFHCITQQMPA